MSTPLGLYTSKILSEHPSAVWALDDQADYISILGASDRDISLWTVESESTTIQEETSFDSPILGEKVYLVTDTPDTQNDNVKIRFSGESIGSLGSFDADLATFAISSFVSIILFFETYKSYKFSFSIAY